MNEHGKLFVQSWDNATAAKELTKLLKKDKKYRKQFESTWLYNETTIYTPYIQDDGGGKTNSDIQYAEVYDALTDGFSTSSDMGINYAFKYHRFIHAQMSANPPSVIPQPNSMEYDDRRSAEVADAFIHYGRKKHKLQEMIDLLSLQPLTYGTGFIKSIYDPFAGDKAIDFDEETGAITMEGDIQIKPCLIWHIWIDSDADIWDDVKHVFQRYYKPYEEVCALFPKHKEKLEELRGQFTKEHFHQKEAKEVYEDLVEVYEYYEKGTPLNGMDGRHCVFVVSKTGEVTLLTNIKSNPHPHAQLPYHIITDVDVPGQVYGKTFVEYITRLQELLNAIDSTVLDNVQAHGVARLVVFDAAELPDEAISSDSWDILNIKGAGGQAPMFINPPALMPDLYKLRDAILVGMEEIAGVNSSMFGNMNREMSALSLQTSINAGNMVRRRLFNKYTLCVESVYTHYLQLVKKHYSDPRKIRVVGEEGAVSVAYYSSADLKDGCTLKVDYGESFSLDPASRREEIVQLIPFMKEAGLTMSQILDKFMLNEVKGLFDMNSVGKRRQLEIFDEMISKFEEDGILISIEPEKNEDHASMLVAAREFRMSMLFKTLDVQLRDAIDNHIDQRIEMGATVATGGTEAPQGAIPEGNAMTQEMPQQAPVIPPLA